jgi:hypothetical protein
VLGCELMSGIVMDVWGYEAGFGELEWGSWPTPRLEVERIARAGSHLYEGEGCIKL